MSGVLPNLFKGIAVVIDNGVGNETQITRIIDNINAGGGHVVALPKRPEPEYDLEHFARASFFIMDWNFLDQGEEGLEAGVKIPAGLKEQMVADNIAFLKRLRIARHAPVFIFTNENLDEVLEALGADQELQHSVEQTHILVKNKSEVVDKLYEVLEDWAKNTPSVLTLKTWERSYLAAANSLFIDLHNRTPYWPVLMWQTFETDGVPPTLEMSKLINRLVESRMGPMNLDLAPFIGAVESKRETDPAGYRDSMNKVLEGERFVRGDRLADDIYAPGDVFENSNDDSSISYWMNIRAECDCLRGSDSLELHLIQLKPVDKPEEHIDPEFGTFTGEKDGEAIVFAMFDGRTFSIRFKEVRIKKLKDIKKKGKRIGRLLPPFITRVQQRFAAYVQRPGMPRIPAAMVEVPPEESEPAAAATA